MKLIDKIRRKFASTPAYTTALMASLVILLAGTIAFSLLAQAVQRQNTSDFSNRINRQAAALSVHTDNAIRSYNRLLLAASAVFNSQAHIDKDIWAHFYNDMRVPEEYPELIGLGYAAYLRQDNQAAFQQAVREEGDAGFTINPQNGQDDYVVITYLQPEDDLNKKAIGFDMNSEQSRHEAILGARDGARVGLTAPVSLVQDEGTQRQNDQGVLMYYPVFEGGVIPDTVVERREKLLGFVYLLMRPSDLIQHYIDTTPLFAKDINISVKDESTNTVLYSLNGSPGKQSRLITQNETLYLDGRPWAFSIAGQETYLIRTGGPLLIVILGLFASVVAAFIAFRLLLSRVRTIEEQFEQKIQKSKDELLALASHQLRTPASGVKQYLGLLLGGFVGELSTQQKDVAQKALDSNERQLNIINELLYVSKIDAGQLRLSMEQANMTKMIRSIVDDFSAQASSKDISLVYKTRKQYTAEFDDRYMRMAIENMISNAIKYSHSGTVVKIRLSQEGSMLKVAICDQGVGLREEDKKRIFDKFERINNDLSRSEGGSGLGLFLALELVRAHHGDIQIESRVGKGSTFTLLLPISQSSEVNDDSE